MSHKFIGYGRGGDNFLRQKEKKADLVFLLNALPHKERLVLSLKYQEELSFEEIALVLRLTLPQVWEIYAAAIGGILGHFLKSYKIRVPADA